MVTVHIILVHGLQRLKLIHARSKQIYARLYSHCKNSAEWALLVGPLYLDKTVKSLAVTFVLVYTILIYANNN